MNQVLKQYEKYINKLSTRILYDKHGNQYFCVDEEIRKRIAEKESKGEYAYEYSALRNHLSKQQCDDFIYSNIGTSGEYVYLHIHEEKKPKLPRCAI